MCWTVIIKFAMNNKGILNKSFENFLKETFESSVTIFFPRKHTVQYLIFKKQYLNSQQSKKENQKEKLMDIF